MRIVAVRLAAAGRESRRGRGIPGPARGGTTITALRLAVYTDYSYQRAPDGLRAERAFALFVAELARACERLTVLGRLDERPEASARHPIGDGVDFVALPFYETLARPAGVLRAMLGSVRVFWRALDEVDCVWLLGPHPLAIVFAVLAAVRGRRPVLGVRQDFPAYVRSRHPGRRSFMVLGALLEGSWRLLARRFGVIVVGPDLARRYADASELLEIAVSLVPGAAIVGEAEAAGRDYDGELTLLSVGRLEAEKNPLLLADAFALLRERDPRWELIVVGEGPAADELRLRLDALGLGEHAQLAGYVPVDDGLGELYGSSHAFLHVSLTEGLPQVLLEAFAGGLPVVATDVGGVGEAVGDRVLLIPPRDPEAAAARVQEIADDASLRLRLIRSGLDYVGSRTIESETRRTADFLAGAAGLR